VMSYHADAIVRRAPALLQTRDGQPPVATVCAATAAQLGLRTGGAVRIRQGDDEAPLAVALDERLPPGCIRIPAAHPSTAALGPMFGPIQAEAAVLDERKVG